MHAPDTPMDPTAWIGKTQQAQDVFSRNLVKRVAATLTESVPEDGQPLPPLWQWCFFQEPVFETGLGVDGHPARGGFLPPAEDRNRMWAGGRVEFIEPLRVGGEAQCTSTITNVEEKLGRTGSLLFVTLRHDYVQDGRLCVREEQDIVYREPSAPRQTSSPMPEGSEWDETVSPTPTLLFRYSAVTFNGHRIHYDHPYATATEGYPDLVVHGPLIATLSLRAFMRANPDKPVRRFAYRGVRPLNLPAPLQLGGRIVEPGQAQLWAGNQDGIVQSADVSFD